MKSAKRIPLIPPFTLSLSKPVLSLSKGAGGGGPPRGQGVDLLFWAFHPPPMPPPKGDITGGTLLIFFWIPAFAGMTILSTAGGGGPLQRAGGGLDVLDFPSSPCAPSEGGHLRWALVLPTILSQKHFRSRVLSNCR